MVMVVRWCSSLFLAVLAAHCCLHGLGDAAVISIDFGSEWIKVALVKVGVDERWRVELSGNNQLKA